VDALPTVFLIDHKGVVRFKSVGAPDRKELDRQIDKLLAEAEAAGPP
jgi:hypothetical protein